MGRRLNRAVLALARAGWRVEFVCAFPPPLEHPNICIRRVGLPAFLRSRRPDHTTPLFWGCFLVAAAWRCLLLACRREVRGFLVFSAGAAFPVLPARWLSRKPMLLFIRSDECREQEIKGVGGGLRRVFALGEKLAVRAATRVLPVTRALAATLAGRVGGECSARFDVLPNDLPASGDREAAGRKLAAVTGRAGAFAVACSAHFSRRKNAGMLLDALAELRDTPVHLALIGDGAEVDGLRQRAAALGVGERVTFAGWRADASELAGGADLFVLPSVAEGMSNSLLEAVAWRRPCLVSRVPEHEELFAGYPEALFDPADPSDLADRIRRAVADPEFRATLARAAEAIAARLTFDWDARVVQLARSGLP